MTIGNINGGPSTISNTVTEYNKGLQVKPVEMAEPAPSVSESKKEGEYPENNASSFIEIRQQMLSNPGYTPNLQDKKLIESIERTNAELVGANRELQISIHDKTHRIMAKVVDKETKEVIKEIPSEKLLDMVYSMLEYSGLIVDEKM